MPDFDDLGPDDELDDLLDDEPEGHAPRGRFARLMKLGGLTTSVGASLVGDRLVGRILPDSVREARTKKMIEKNAAKMVRTMGELKGAAMKLGQILSMAPLQEEHIPEELRDALAVLQRSAPPMGWKMVCDQIEEAFDQPVESLYRFFDPAPLASASIGQVHRAELFDGTPVAVKVQYPGVEQTLVADLKNIATMAQMGRPFASARSIDEVLEEIREVLAQESDYRVEADNLRAFHEALAGRDDVRVPRPVGELTRKTVLTMELMEGRKLDHWLLERAPEKRSEVVRHFIDLVAWLFYEKQLLHADPHPGNYLIDAEGKLVILDFGAVRTYDPAFTDDLLRLLVTVWEGRVDELPALFARLGFGEGKVTVSGEVLDEWLKLVVAPLFHEGPFAFGKWNPHNDTNRFMLRHPSLIGLTPPREMIFYGRTAIGIWGLMQRLDITIDVKQLSREIIARRGLL
ncbi:MAG: AarF/ABC1/UbiB kinase family protein [Deltaproteobacteria bacterium]|nr:AarF/ABC1/UbiB kinase family protein [Deltaproteobacteria bacterium]